MMNGDLSIHKIIDTLNLYWKGLSGTGQIVLLALMDSIHF